MFYISQNIRCREIEPFQFASSIKILTLENKSRKRKLLIFGTYKPTNISNRSLLNELCNAINFYDTLYKNCVLLGDLNIVRDNTELQNFCESFLFNTSSRKQLMISRLASTILLVSVNSGQISIKWHHLAYDVESPPLKSCKNLNIKSEANYLFPTLSSSANFYIYQLPEGLMMSKILAHGIDPF